MPIFRPICFLSASWSYFNSKGHHAVRSFIILKNINFNQVMTGSCKSDKTCIMLLFLVATVVGLDRVIPQVFKCQTPWRKKSKIVKFSSNLYYMFHGENIDIIRTLNDVVWWGFDRKCHRYLFVLLLMFPFFWQTDWKCIECDVLGK